MSESDVVKIAIKFEGKQPILTVFDRRQPLNVHISSLIRAWSLDAAPAEAGKCIDDNDDDSKAGSQTASNANDVSERYALKFADSNVEKYVTETNKSEVRNGSVLRLDRAPALVVSELRNLLKQAGSCDADATAKLDKALDSLTSLSLDLTVAHQFLQCPSPDGVSGLALLVDSIQESRLSDTQLSAALCSLVELAEHGLIDWSMFSRRFLARVASVVNSGAPAVSESSTAAPPSSDKSPAAVSSDSSRKDAGQSAAKTSRQAVKAALSLLENVVVNCDQQIAFVVESEVPLPNLMLRIQMGDTAVQQSSLALLNAILARVNESKKRSMAASIVSKRYRLILTRHLIEHDPHVGEQLAHELYVLQTHILNLLSRHLRRGDGGDSDDDSEQQDSREVIEDRIRQLRRFAFGLEDGDQSKQQHQQPDDSEEMQRRKSRDFQQLGFSNVQDPTVEFVDNASGLLTLECLLYLARKHSDLFTRLVLENACRSQHRCPLVRASVRLTTLLLQILHVGEPPDDRSTAFYPMFFSSDSVFEECFCVGIELLSKTWREMRATDEDFYKVMSVVHEQITRALLGRQKVLVTAVSGAANASVISKLDVLSAGAFDPPASFDAFRTRLNALSYSEITSLRQQVLSVKEECESQAQPVIELREQLRPDMLELVRAQRLRCLVQGTRFAKYSNRGQRNKDKFWYVRLSPNHKLLHYGDCDDQTAPSIEQLTHKVAVCDITALCRGRECPHMKDYKGKKSLSQLAFSLIIDSSSSSTASSSPESGSLDFVANDLKTLNYWLDGVNTLLGKSMTSSDARDELDMLLSMEVKLRLLDTDGLDIPQQAPPLPDDPPDYDFCV